MKSTPFIILFILCLLASCTGKQSSPKGVVATTGWTAAYALAAGATDISILAPYEMVHPSEYELRPGDIGRLTGANLVVYAGYEVMVNQIKTGLKIPEERLLMISTGYKLEEIEKSVMLIAKSLGTEAVAGRNMEEIRLLFAEGREAVHQKGLDTLPALVHFFQESIAEELGIKSLMVFGPAPPEPRQILAMAQTNATLIIDNAHNPVGGPMRDILKDGDYKQLLNFPGLYQTRTIADVIQYNISQLTGK